MPLHLLHKHQGMCFITQHVTETNEQLDLGAAEIRSWIIVRAPNRDDIRLQGFFIMSYFASAIIHLLNPPR